MRCRSVLTRVDALRTGELPPAEQTAVEKHFESCPSCGESVADVDLLASAMRTIIPSPTESCRQAIADRFEQIGDVHVVFSNDGLRLIRRGGTLDELRAAYARRFCRTLVEGTLPPALRKQVMAALAGEGVTKPRVDWSAESTDLEREVFSVLERIPRGEVRTYEWVARQAGHPRAVRAVGNILARNPLPFVVPCHRVVPASGGTGNYIFGGDAKRELLRAEGVDVEALDALADAGVRYLGSRTTKIACFPTCRDAKRIRAENRVPFRDASQALEKGFRPCRHCQPFAA